MHAHIRVAVAGLVVLAALVGPSVTAFRQDVAIRYRWNKGETLRYRSTQQSTTTMSGLPGGMGDMNVEQTQVQILRGVVRDIATDGTTTLEQLIESMQMDINSPMGKITFDSANPDASVSPNPMMTKMVSAMIGEPFTVVLAPTGAVKKVEGFTRIMEKMLQNAPQDRGGAALLSAMKGSFNDDALLNVMGQGFTQFPDRPLKVGDSWSSQVTMSMPMAGGLTTSITATLKAIEGSGADQVARIATTLSIKLDPALPPPANPIGLSMKMGESTGEGETLFDVARGRLLRSTVRSAMPMTMSGPGPDGTPLTMKSDLKSTMTVELIPQ